LDFDGGLGGEAEETALFLPVMRQVFAQSQQPARRQRVGFWNASTLGPDELNCDGSGRQTILNLQAQYGFPIFIGEFSAYTASVTNGNGNPSATDWVKDSLAYFQTKGFSWCYHSWREYYGWDAEITQAEAMRIMNGGSGINRTSNAPTISAVKNYFALP
jgi:hypothetical protein